MSPPRDIVVTWPKTKPLENYVRNLRFADKKRLVINYRVARLPHWDDAIEDHGSRGWAFGATRPRCYMVHSGFVRGYCEVLYTCYQEEGMVEEWPAGLYVVRSPEWNPIEPIPMRGFQGWRWWREGS